uniref:Protein kinase domain-containing protein n=1 Tax=Chrysotila carterae TaxID=13221 RepID=A0A7S4B1Y9_CHRCT|mmetsp:Transcript_22309/g.48687  ORF Transcript_22309/g.48687 Transcript_22309/m.48687 type:complete len:608 (-) Transcript_22309:509-2332(-)
MGDHVKELMEDADEGTVWDAGGHRYQLEKVVGNGAFGIVWRARSEDGETVAIKKVLLDRRYHNRELQMMKVMDHECIVRLRDFFEKAGRKKDETYLHLVMDFLPDTLRSVALSHHKRRKRFQVEHIRAFLWQTFRALEYIHARRICHRDIKPDNILCDPSTLQCRLCDFGCSKVLVKGQPNVSYICSRYYRAPELMFGATEYGVGVDVWSVGTILMELLLGHLPFQGQDSTQQHLVEIMKLLGTPSDRDLQSMQAVCRSDDLPKLKPFPWDRIFPPGTPADAIDLAQRLILYDPDQRLTAPQTLAHPFFDGAAQLVEGSSSTAKSPSSRQSTHGLANNAAEFEHLIKKCFEQLGAQGAGFEKMQGTMLHRLERLWSAKKTPQELVEQVVTAIRQELSASLKQRDEDVRGVQKRLLIEAQQMPNFPPEGADADADDGSSDEVAKLNAELAEAKAASAAAAKQQADDKATLLAAIAAAQAELSAKGGGGGRPVEAAAQTEESADSQPPTPSHGRRSLLVPSRQANAADHHLATASPVTQRAAEFRSPASSGLNHMMVNTDNLGQVTPLASFSPAVSGGGSFSGKQGVVEQSSSPLVNARADAPTTRRAP